MLFVLPLALLLVTPSPALGSQHPAGKGATLAPPTIVVGPFVSPPVTPGFFKGRLPTVRPSKPGQPIRFGWLGSPAVNRVRQLEVADRRGTPTHRAVPVPAAGGSHPTPFGPTAVGDPPPAFTTPLRNFPGMSGGAFPPDTNGDVGKTQYVQIINDSFAVWDKNGTPLQGPTSLSALYGNALTTTQIPSTSLCRTNESGDPVVLYDRQADRWLISSFAFKVDANNNPVAPFEQCIAISATADARTTGGYYVYDFNVSGGASQTKFPDYPKFGVWPNAYFMSTDEFGGTMPPDAFTNGGGAYAFDRANMLAGNAATFQYFDTTERHMLPSDMDGSTAPPSGSPNFFTKFVDGTPDRMDVRTFTVTSFSPAVSAFNAVPQAVPVAAFDSDMCGNNESECIDEPSSAPGGCPPSNPATNPGCLDALSDRLMFRAQYRNFGDHETLMLSHTVDAGSDRAGMDWHELRRTPPGSGLWSVAQEQIYAPADSIHRWMGSVAMNGSGDAALGYNVSSTSVNPGIRYAGRLSTDAINTMPQGEATLIGGGGSQTACQAVFDNAMPPNQIACRGRWGDYSDMTVDPVDDCTFWYTTQYVGSGGSQLTRIGAFRFPHCVPSIGISDVSQNEGNSGTTSFDFHVTLSGPSSVPVTVDYATADGSATTADNDYQAESGTVTFAPGDTDETVSIDVNGDTKFEPNEDFFVNLSNENGATLADDQGHGTILNDDSPPRISIDDVSQNEGDSGTTPFTFTVSLSNASYQTVTVDYATQDGSATDADNDYEPTSGTLTFAPDETSKQVTVDVNGDNTFEEDEDFFVNLTNPTNATIDDPQGEGTILNDDPIPAASINDVSMDEGNFGPTNFVFTVSLSNPSYQTIMVDYSTADGTAMVADNDYQPTAGTVTFAPGETSKTVTVVANGDTKIEPNETFFVNLSNPRSSPGNPNNATIADGQGQGTIVNDDLNPNAACTITGTNKDDHLVGTPGDDVICGLNGDDLIEGMGGNDVLRGDNGQDVLIGGDGNDLLLGANGKDDLRGGNGNDNLQGGNGEDTLVGGAGSDALFGENAPDSLNTRDGVPGNDLADGGSAPDTCSTDPGDGRVDCESG
jgi:hypothetical protein